MCVHQMHSVCQVRSEQNASFLGTGVADVCEPPYGFWFSKASVFWNA